MSHVAPTRRRGARPPAVTAITLGPRGAAIPPGDIEARPVAGLTSGRNQTAMLRAMSGDSVRFMMFPAGGRDSVSAPPARRFQELWFNLAPLRWGSLVLVPAEKGMSVAEVATSLADVGSRLRDSPVTAIIADGMDFESARILADLQLRVLDRHPPASAEGPVEAGPGGPFEMPPSSRGGEPPQPSRDPGPPPGARGDTRLVTSTVGQVVVALQPVVEEPLGVAIAHAADAVVLCMQLRRSRLSSARRTIELIGHDRISGAILVP